MAVAASPQLHLPTPAHLGITAAPSSVRIPRFFSRLSRRVSSAAISRPNLSSRRRCFAELNENPAEDFTTSEAPAKSVQIDLNLPRRRLMAEFTCNACGVRTQRLINPHAYEKGTVYVQCSGCEVYHRLVDNLGLVVEFRYEANEEGSL